MCVYISTGDKVVGSLVIVGGLSAKGGSVEFDWPKTTPHDGTPTNDHANTSMYYLSLMCT
jgi:hypothetical protein